METLDDKKRDEKREELKALMNKAIEEGDIEQAEQLMERILEL